MLRNGHCHHSYCAFVSALLGGVFFLQSPSNGTVRFIVCTDRLRYFIASYTAFEINGIGGLYDKLKSGAPRSISDEEIDRLIRKTIKTKPKNGTHWSCRSMAKETAASKSTV